MVAIMGIFVINNSDTLFSLKNDEAAVVATSKFTKAQLKEMYLLPDEVEACFTRFELKGIRKTFGGCFVDSRPLNRIQLVPN